MNINLLAINVGNSRVAIGLFSGGELTSAVRIPLENREALAGAIAEAWKTITDSENPSVAGASVNPLMLESIEHTVMHVTGKRVEWIGSDIDVPLKVLTDAPLQTGMDRIVNIAAAYEQMEKACVVVDAGTAITIDCCNDKGEFLGGAIALGASTWLKALHEQTAKLPQVPLAVPEGAWGRSTEQAMLHGVYHGIRGMVKELVENYATELGNWPEIIATGGDAKILFEGWELIHAISPDLTLYGIALAFTNHYF